jgi:translation initiation factor eIF-2B subunit delta/methylthioribose-1-phosphate isomerase
LSETLKIAPHGWNGDLALLEEHPGREVWEPTTPKIAVRNFYFDRTPAEHITQIISEQGPLSREQIEQQATALARINL